MKIFISWSGEKSKEVAKALREWIPMVIQVVQPYVSSEDIYKGERWSHDVSEELQLSFFGIICVTKENLEAPWIQFEAGALSKTIDSSRVSPFLFDVKISEVSDPFKQFQATTWDKDDIKKLLDSINLACTSGQLETTRLETVFELFWPTLNARLQGIHEYFSTQEEVAPTSNKNFDNSSVLEEILSLTRKQHIMLTERNQDQTHLVSKGIFLSNDDYSSLTNAYYKIVQMHNEKAKGDKNIPTGELYKPLIELQDVITHLSNVKSARKLEEPKAEPKAETKAEPKADQKS